MARQFAMGLDYGTNSVRAVVVDTADGSEVGAAVWAYAHGDQGVVLDDHDPHLARQHPQDYLDGAAHALKGALEAARGRTDVPADAIVGIGVDATGSTPIPVDANGEALAMDGRFAANPHAMAWLWKDHTSHAEAAAFTDRAAEMRPAYLAKCGGTYSSEWFWAKMLHCASVAPEVFDAAYTWVELQDFVPAHLTGTQAPQSLRRGICAAGHKGAFHTEWGGYPDAAFLNTLSPQLVRIRESLPDRCYTIADHAGRMSDDWALRTGLPAGIPVAIGAIDAHLGAVGSGIEPGALVRILGTSTCDLIVAPLEAAISDVPGICGIVPESVLPGMYGLEAGQAAVGDVFNWFVSQVQPGGPDLGSHEALTVRAATLRPGASGLLALDWLNGNRSVLTDPRLTGAILGLTLRSTPAEIYRALIEATAFGARLIIERFESCRVPVTRVINCGGIAAKNPFLMQVYADILNRPMEISASEQTCALGAAIAGAVVGGAHPTFAAATSAMTGVKPDPLQPIREHVTTYNRLFGLYKDIHDAFGLPGLPRDLAQVMKELLAIREAAG